MGSESVGSCAPPLPASLASPLGEEARRQEKTMSHKGPCFSCKEEGHWVRDCPLRFKLSPSSGGPVAYRPTHPELQCPCGSGDCIVLTSRTERNPGRDFYRCPAKLNERCGFFKWCDEACSGQKHHSPIKPYQQRHGTNSPVKPSSQFDLKNVMKLGKQLNEHQNPMCSCGAGTCIVLTAHEGENTGRKYFACPIKKGHGACNHFQWCNNAGNLTEVQLPEKTQLFSMENNDHGACNHLGSAGKLTEVQLPEKTKLFDLENNEFRDAVNPAAPTSSPTLLNDPLSPPSPPASMRTRKQKNVCLFISPVKRLSLGERSPGVGSSK
ncbi:hypothetical protein AXF42_Ash002169 [Apostasia shenzhenica]|uniref:Uncharacterized protein n=1 Tax=Apostasia shenzhenica TaxID=1088818 RepID=A0A2I0AN28_9ASPA|nr:hypothetical protein AXF42_Ash002169 [Apostasia shenzhenica]